MNLEFYPLKKLKKEILDIVAKYLDIRHYQLFFFGSRVKGDNFMRADIDIGIEGPKDLLPIIKIKIEQDLENLPLLYKIDFIDFKNVSDRFKKEAKKYFEPIN